MKDCSTEYGYLDLLDRKLDAKQKAACCRTENTIVAAGAGSGKTQVLATRFAWLVMSEKVSVSKILTLTFTRKAAAEMYERIYKTLSFFAGNEQTPALERERARQAVADFSESHIQTLDSYRSSVVKQAANRYGIRPDFASSEESLDLQFLALQFVMQKVGKGDGEALKAIRHFAGTGNVQAFAENYLAAIVSKYSSLADPDGHFEAMLKKQRAFVTEQWNSLVADLPGSLEILSAGLEDLRMNPKLDYSAAESAIQELKAFIAGGKESLSVANDSGLWEGGGLPLSAPALSANCARLKSLVTNANGGFKAGCRELKDPLQNFSELASKLSGLASYIKDYAYTRGLYRLLDEFCGELNRKKRLSGVLTFKDIADMARKILVEQKDIRQQEKAAYSKIMIDEFQDNNGRDRDLLFLLAERADSFVCPSSDDADALHQALKGALVPDKLFFVGDEKQSIYRFRGADVAVFNELKDDLGTKPLQMTNNYRSSAELLSAFNQLFGGFRANAHGTEGLPSVFNRESNVSFEACYPEAAMASKLDLTSRKEMVLPQLTEDKIRTRVCMINELFIEDDKNGEQSLLSTQDQIGYFIAKTIADIRKRKGPESFRYSDFAILDRSRTNRPSLVRWLNAFGIPYSLDQQGSLFQEAPVNDIYNMLRLFVYPSDKIAFASVLASPFVNLDAEGCQLVLADYAGQYAKDMPWQAFSPELDEELAGDLSPAGFARYKAAADSFPLFREEALQDKVSRSLDRLWSERGYRYELLLGKSENLLSEHYDLLFEMARKSDEEGQSLAWFVDQLAAIKDKRPGFFKVDLDEDISNVEYPLEKEDAVSIMTIHKSKGLQFPHVFVLGCCGSAASEKDGSYFYDDEYGLSVKLRSSGENLFFERKREDMDMMAAEEFKRIFYVAVTRAEEDVYIVGNWKEIKNERPLDELPMLQRIICSYYEGAKTRTFPTDTEAFVEGSPFYFRSIQPVAKGDAFKPQSDRSNLSDLVRKAAALYAGEATVAFEHPASNRKTPSSMETEGLLEFSEEKDLYPALGRLLDSYGGDRDEEEAEELEKDEGFIASGSFDSAGFGSLVHRYLEAHANGIAPESFLPEARLLKDVKADDERILKETCASMVARFAASAQGRAFAAAKEAGRLAKAEYGFRMFKDGDFYTGSIDLLYQEASDSEGRPLYTIVDYKSNSKINRERYRGQLECYRTALAQMLGVEERQIRLYLYFLRFDKALEL